MYIEGAGLYCFKNTSQTRVANYSLTERFGTDSTKVHKNVCRAETRQANP
jgi:hypothetical protein